MKHDGKIETCPFRGPLFTNKNSGREHIPQNNHKNRLLLKHLNKNKDTSNTSTNLDKISSHRLKVNSICFEDPYDHINHVDNTHEYDHLIDTQEQNREDYEDEQE